MYIVVFGNAFNGMTVFGPFQTSEEARTYAESHADGDDWNVVPVYKP